MQGIMGAQNFDFVPKFLKFLAHNFWMTIFPQPKNWAGNFSLPQLWHYWLEHNKVLISMINGSELIDISEAQCW